MAILVVGTGRSGTTTVARILHEELGYNMGENFCLDTNKDKHCYEEDLLYSIDTSFINGTVSLPVWEKVVASKIEANYQRYGEQWGFKSPTLSYTLPLWLPYFNTLPIIIWANRTPSLVVASFMKCYRWSEGRALGEYKTRIHHLGVYLSFIAHSKISFNEDRKEDSEVKKEIEEILNKQF